MHSDILALVRTKLEADSVLAVLGPGGGKVRVLPVGARVAADPEPPYIRIGLEGGSLDIAKALVILDVEVISPGADTRWAVFRRVVAVLHNQRIAKPGLNVLRFSLSRQADGIPDYPTGTVKLSAVFRGVAAIDRALF